MLKSLKIITGNFKKDPIGNILTIIFVTLSVFLMDISLSRFLHMKYINSLVKDCGLYENYMYATPPDKGGNERNAAVWEHEREILDGMKENGAIENWYNVVNWTTRNLTKYANSFNTRFYPKELAVDLRFPISKGIWFDKYGFEDDASPVVIGSDLAGKFRVGDRFTLYEDGGEAVVIGVLARNTLIPRAGAGGNGMDLEGIFTDGSDKMIIISENGVDELMSYSYHYGAIIKVTSENRQRVFDEIGDLSFTFTFEELAEASYEDNRLLTEMQTTVFMLMMIVCAAGVSSGNLLGVMVCKKKYAVCFLCGMDWKTGIRITFAESMIKLLLPAAAGYAAFYKWCADQNFYALRITAANAAVTVVFAAAIFLLTSLLPLLDIWKTAPVKIIVET